MNKMGWLKICLICVLVPSFGRITAVDFTIKDCNEDDGVFYEDTHSVFTTSVEPMIHCRAISSQTMPHNVEYKIKLEFQSQATSTPGIVFNVIDDKNYDMIFFMIDAVDCFELASVKDNFFSKTDGFFKYCNGFIMEADRAFGVELIISGQTLQLNIENGGFEKELINVLQHPQSPSSGLIQAPDRIGRCKPNCQFMFRDLDLIPTTESQYYTAIRGTLPTPNNGNNELSLLRLEFNQLGYIRDKYCFVALSFTELDLGPAKLYIEGDEEHEEGEIKTFHTTEKYMNIYFYSSTLGSSNSGFNVDYHVFGCGIDQPDISFICQPGDHTERYEDFYRSTSHTSNPSSYYSDHDFPMAWYRFSSCAGKTMPTISPGRKDVCGTRDPIWMQTTDNSASTYMVGYFEGTACVYKDGDDCVSEWGLPYFNCENGDRLYYLKPTPNLSAYCIGDKIKCDPMKNLTSIDGSGCSPCSESHVPSMSAPVLGEWIKGNQEIFHLPCTINPENTEIEKEYQVDWYIEHATGRHKIRTEITAETEVSLQSTEVLKDYLQNNIVCEVKAKYVQGANFGDPIPSEPYFIGLQFEKEDQSIPIGGTLKIYFRMTIPINCDGSSCMDIEDEHCFLDVFTLTTTKDMRRQPCQNFLYFEPELITANGCSQRIMCNKWQDMESTYISVKNTLQEGILEYTHTLYAVTKDRNRDLWNNLVGEMKLNVDDTNIDVKKATCWSNNDPHHTTFLNTRYDVHDITGEYVLYKSFPSTDKNMKTLVTAEFGSCYGSNALCNIKIGVRVNNEAVVYNPGGPSKDNEEPIRYMGPGYGEPGFQVVQTNNFNKIEFRFPRGDRAIVTATSSNGDRPFININIETPKETQEITGNGLCGQIDQDPQSGMCPELRLRDGTIYEKCPSGDRKIPDFSNDWRVHDDERLILAEDIIPIDVAEPINTFACSVHDLNHFLSSDEDWQFREALTVEHCYPYEGDDMMDIFRRTIGAKGRKRLFTQRGAKKLHEGTNINAGKTARTSNPEQKRWIKDSALEYCRDYIWMSSVASTCNITNVIDVENAIDECALDIMLTNSTVWARETLVSLRESCMLSVYSNTTMWEFEDEGNETILKPPLRLTENLCPDECSGNGNCVDGNCECYSGFIQDDCSHDITIPPVIHAVFDDGICYTKECDDITILGGDIVSSKNLTCHYNTDQSEELIHGIMMNFDTVSCPMPRIEQSPKGYTTFTVSLSNDRVIRSEHIDAVAVTAECVTCSFSTANQIQCALQASSCLIENNCYAEGDVSGADVCLRCYPTNEQYDWTKTLGCGDKGETEPSTGHTGLIIGTVCFFVAIVVAVSGIGLLFRMRIKQRKQTYHPNMEMRQGIENDSFND